MNFTLYNVVTCKGFSTELGGGCTQVWLMATLLFFIIAIIRKWIGEAMGIDFHFWLAIAGGMSAFIIIASIFGSAIWAFVAGLIGMIILGFGGGAFFGGEEE